MRREGAQSRTRLAATGLRKETPDGESAKEIWPARVRAPGECAPPGGPRFHGRRLACRGGACVLPGPVEEEKAREGEAERVAVAVNFEGWGGRHSQP
jgi:hypothetical protein